MVREEVEVECVAMEEEVDVELWRWSKWRGMGGGGWGGGRVYVVEEVVTVKEVLKEVLFQTLPSATFHSPSIVFHSMPTSILCRGSVSKVYFKFREIHSGQCFFFVDNNYILHS